MKTQSGLMLLLAVLSVSEGDGSRAVGRPGGDVTLPCTYDIRNHGALMVCWGRGELPTYGCNNLLLSTDGRKVIKGSRVSSRYQLLGRLDEGDVSLTILNVSETDAGRYGCRVAIPGPFNDLEYHIDLIVEEAPPTRKTGSDVTAWTGSDVTGNQTTESMVTLAQDVQQLQVANIVRVAFIIVIIPPLLLTVAYRVWRRGQRSDSRLNQSEEEEEEEEQEEGSSSV